MDEKPPMYNPQAQPQGQPYQQPAAYPPTGYPPAQQQQPPAGYPPAGYPPTQPQPQTVVVTQPAAVVVGAMNFGPNPQSLTCPHCRASIVTRTNHEMGILSWLLVGVLCFLGCWPCCLIPFCVDDCKDVEHHCPNCNRLLGTHKRL